MTARYWRSLSEIATATTSANETSHSLRTFCGARISSPPTILNLLVYDTCCRRKSTSLTRSPNASPRRRSSPAADNGIARYRIAVDHRLKLFAGPRNHPMLRDYRACTADKARGLSAMKKHAQGITLSSRTTTMHIALMLSDVEKGDRVLGSQPHIFDDRDMIR